MDSRENYWMMMRPHALLLVSELVTPHPLCYRRSHSSVMNDQEKKGVRRRGLNCWKIWVAPHNHAYILKHGAHCTKLTADNRAKANKLLNKGSFAEKVNQLMLQEAEQHESPCKHLKSDNSEGGEVVKRTVLDVQFGNHGRKLLQACLDDLIVRLICITHIPPSVIDCEQWKDMLAVKNSAYCLTSSSGFIDNHIPAEAAHVCTLSIKYFENLLSSH